MTELIYHIATTADHFIAGPNGEADESIFRHHDDVIADFLQNVKTYNAVLMGRNTYEYGFQFGLKPGEPSGIALAAKPELKHYIFSKSMVFKSNEKVELIRDDAVSFVRNLKQSEEGLKVWLCGGGQLASSLLEAALIDKLILKVSPVLIGRGIPLFGNSRKKVRMKLLDLKKYTSGVTLPTYQISYH